MQGAAATTAAKLRPAPAEEPLAVRVAGGEGEGEGGGRGAPVAAVPAQRNDYMLYHPSYNMQSIEGITPQHRPPRGLMDYAAYLAVGMARKSFDFITGHAPAHRDPPTEAQERCGLTPLRGLRAFAQVRP